MAESRIPACPCRGNGPRLQAQLLGLERRVGRGDRKSIDHGAPSGHDGVANAACGTLVSAAGERGGGLFTLAKRQYERLMAEQAQ